MKIHGTPSKKHIFYPEINDYIEWDGEYFIEDKDGGWASGFIQGTGITGKKYTANVSFSYEGGGSWNAELDTIEDIEEV